MSANTMTAQRSAMSVLAQDYDDLWERVRDYVLAVAQEGLQGALGERQDVKERLDALAQQHAQTVPVDALRRIAYGLPPAKARTELRRLVQAADVAADRIIFAEGR
jgi:hypothetical protein